MFSSWKHKVEIQFSKAFYIRFVVFLATKHHLSSLIIWCKNWLFMLLNHLGLHVSWCNNWCLMVVDLIEHHWMFDEVEGEQNYHSHCWKFIFMTNYFTICWQTNCKCCTHKMSTLVVSNTNLIKEIIKKIEMWFLK